MRHGNLFVLSHRRARARDPARWLWWCWRVLATPWRRGWRGVRRGSLQLPPGPLLLVCQLPRERDYAVLLQAADRRLLFGIDAHLPARWLCWRLLPRWGAFPVRWERSDEKARQTAGFALARGSAVALAWRSHLQQPDPQRSPARLALESGAQLLLVRVECRGRSRILHAGELLHPPRTPEASPELIGSWDRRLRAQADQLDRALAAAETHPSPRE